MDIISSLQNPKVKQILALSKAKERRKTGLTVIEGARELMLALKAKIEPQEVLVCRDVYANSEYPDLLSEVSNDKIREISYNVFKKLAYRENSDGLISVIKFPKDSLEQLKVSANPFIIILEAVEKPGNLGAILRTADSAGADAVIVCDGNTDLYNPNVIRSSIGCIFTVPTVIASSCEVVNWLKCNKIVSYAAELTSSTWYHHQDFTSPSAIVMGTEADGLTDYWLENADKRIKIPMLGIIDSLNVSVSTAVLTFEAMRQRNFGGGY